MLSCLPFCDNLEEWEAFASRADDAWFWHTTQCMEYLEEYSQKKFISNRSFIIDENNETLAICPVFIELADPEEGPRQFSYGGQPIPLSALANGLTPAKRQQVLRLYVDTLGSMAKEEDVEYVSVRASLLASSNWEYAANPLLKHGFIDLSYISQVIDLNKDIDALWADLRKGHKSDVTRARRSCGVTVWDQETITTEKFLEYQLLHAKDAGRVTRSQRTFDLMLSWIRQGLAILVEAHHEGGAVAFSLVVIFGTGAYYGSSCKDPEFNNLPGSHLIQWETIRWLKEHGFVRYEIGMQQFFPQWFDLAMEKDISISRFKRGFGGSTVPLVTSEFFYSKDLLKLTFENRLQQYLSNVSAG